jgi:putative sigma-54 modulation protein
MQINVVERHNIASQSLKEYAIKKTETLNRYFNRVMRVDITLSAEKERHSADFIVHLINRKVVKAREESEDMYAAIDLGVDKLKRQLVRYKDKVKDKGTGNEVHLQDEVADQDQLSDLSTITQEQEYKKIIRTDHFVRKPMLPEEAASQLEETDQVFLVFMNVASGTPNVIYRRNDGNYGLIEP